MLTSNLRELTRQTQRDADVATTNLADGMADRNEKTTWMLRAHLKGYALDCAVAATKPLLECR